MFITYYWVDNWLKLMAACAEQMQPLAADGDARTALEAELEQLRGALADAQAAMTAAVQARGLLQAELERQRLQAETDRADLARQLAAGGTAEKRLGEEAAARAAAQAEAGALRGAVTAAQAELRQARAEAQRSRQELTTLQARSEQGAGEAMARSNRLTDEIAGLRRERQAAVAQAHSLRAENTRLAAEIKAHETTVASLRSELNGLQENLQAALAAAADAGKASERARLALQELPPGEARRAGKRQRKPAVTESPAAAPLGLALRFCKPAGWSEPVHIYYWNTDPAVAAPAWPGPAMADDGEGWWSHRIEGTREAEMIFSDAASHQTGNLHRDRSGSLRVDGAWVDDA